jgi:endonuclease-3
MTRKATREGKTDKGKGRRDRKRTTKRGTKRGSAPSPPEVGQDRLEKILEILDEEYPKAHTALEHKDPYELLVATILSAQCTDERVNKVTPVLFEKAPDPLSLHRMKPEEVEEIIRSTGFYRNKTKSLKSSARVIVERFGGKVPDTMEELVELPGVARKTANVVLGSAFGKAEGIVVDTHVKRVSARLGLTDQTNPVKIEEQLMSSIPEERWIRLSHQLIHHGRRVCKARKPRCSVCRLAPHCPSAQIEV